MDYTDCYKVYVLALEEEKFYVGITKEVARRYCEHKSGKGSYFTRKYKPICVVYKRNMKTKYKNIAEKTERNVTISLMKKYGIENVRGGEFCQVETNNVIKYMKKEMYEEIVESYNLKNKKNTFKQIDKKLDELNRGILRVNIDGMLIKDSDISGQIKSKNNKKANSFWWKDNF